MPENQITREKFEALHSRHPKRICFAGTHQNALKETPGNSQYFGKIYGRFNVPFLETVQIVFREYTGLSLLPNQNYPGYWSSIRTEEKYRQIAQWIQAQGTRVFLRSLLPCCVALDHNLESERTYTVIGRHEHEAKINRSKVAINELVKIAAGEIKGMPFYRDAEFIAAIPSRPEKEFDLPSVLAKEIADKLRIFNLTKNFHQGKKRDELKDLPISKKWKALEYAQIQFNLPAQIPQNRGILLDDKYQSGVTMHYVAKVMQDSGMQLPLGLAIVKTRGDDDNL